MKRSKEVKKVKATKTKSDSKSKVSDTEQKESNTKQTKLSVFINTNKIDNKDILKDSNLLDFPKDKPVSIYSWNVAGLRAILKKDEFKIFLDKENPDILCLNETKVDEDVIIKNNLENILGNEYKAYFNCCKIKRDILVLQFLLSISQLE